MNAHLSFVVVSVFRTGEYLVRKSKRPGIYPGPMYNKPHEWGYPDSPMNGAYSSVARHLCRGHQEGNDPALAEQEVFDYYPFLPIICPVYITEQLCENLECTPSISEKKLSNIW